MVSRVHCAKFRSIVSLKQEYIRQYRILHWKFPEFPHRTSSRPSECCILEQCRRDGQRSVQLSHLQSNRMCWWQLLQMSPPATGPIFSMWSSLSIVLFWTRRPSRLPCHRLIGLHLHAIRAKQLVHSAILSIDALDNAPTSVIPVQNTLKQ